MAAILGGALSLSGFLLQTFFENPIAGPFVLGISSGAKMTVAFAMIYFMEVFGSVSSYALILAAFAGSLLSVCFILLFSRKIPSMSTLLVAGIMIGYICTAITDFTVTFAADSNIINLHNWAKGSFSGMNWSHVGVAAIVVGIAGVITFFLAKPIGAYQLGEAYARSMGVNIKVFRTALIVLSSILSATVTAFAGPISFVGIAVPFLIKRCLNTSKPLVVIPATFLGGGVFDYIRGLDDRIKAKPCPDGALDVAEKLGVQPCEVLYIGDSGVDMQTAVNAGFTSCGVLWGFRTEKELRDNGAKYIARKPADILEIMSK